MSKKNEMPYACAFIQELMRFRTLAPFGLPHKANADVNVEGCIIPEGTTVTLYNVYFCIATVIKYIGIFL